METENGSSENLEIVSNLLHIRLHNHRFIPRLYLRHFVTKDTQGDKKKEKIYVVDKQHRRFEDEPRLIKHVGSEDNYNTFQLAEDLEKDPEDEGYPTREQWLRVIEKRQAKLLERVKTEKSIENIDKRELASLVAWMYGRVPIQKRVAKEILKELNYQWFHPYDNDVDPVCDNNFFIDIMDYRLQKEEFLNILEAFRYTLVTIPKESKKFLITSDNPVTIACNEELSARYFEFFLWHIPSIDFEIFPNYDDFENKSLRLFLPIDRKFGLLLHRNKDIKGHFLLKDGKQIDFLNSYTVKSADKEIYAPEITDELKVLVKNYWGNINMFEIDSTQYTPKNTYGLRKIYNVKGSYTGEGLNREKGNGRFFHSMHIFRHPTGTKSKIEYFTVIEPIPSTHQYVCLEENRNYWSKWLKVHKLLVFFAPHQTDGIGSHGRRWISDKEDFHVNLIFYCDQILPFSQIAAYTACQLLAQETMQTERFKIRWPNDVMVEDFDGIFKKIGGFLTAVRKEKSRYWVTVGVGINYNLENFSNIDQPTASVKSFLNSLENWVTVGIGINYNPEDFSNIAQSTPSVKSFLNSLGKSHKLYRENDFKKDELSRSVQCFAELFLKNLALVQKNGLAAFYDKEDPRLRFGSKHYWLYLGQKVTIFDEDKKTQLTGRFDKLTDDGALQLACDDGKTEIVLNGTGLKLAENR